MKRNPATWLTEIWKRSATRVAGDYAALASQHPYLLADIALLGFVYIPKPTPRDVYDAGRLEGRRELALEIINLANAPHAELQALIAHAQQPGGKS